MTTTETYRAALAAVIAADVAVAEIERRREGTTGERAKLYDALKAAQWARTSADEDFARAIGTLTPAEGRAAMDARIKGFAAECERLRRERLAPKKTPAKRR